MTRATLILVLLLLAPAAQARPDEPGSSAVGAEEPGLRLELAGPEATVAKPVPEAPRSRPPRFRIDFAFGLASLLVDPDVGEGMGGGLSVTYGLHRRVGVELSIFLGQNAYDGKLGTFDVSFLAGNINLGPTIQLTPPGSRWLATVDLSIGSYIVVGRPIQEDSWSFGVGMGMTLGVKLARWFGIGIKPRYHIFNLGHLGGGELKDLKSFSKVGVIDRFELPGYLAFYF